MTTESPIGTEMSVLKRSRTASSDNDGRGGSDAKEEKLVIKWLTDEEAAVTTSAKKRARVTKTHAAASSPAGPNREEWV